MVAGKRVARSQTYEPTSRGGYCNSDLVASTGEVDNPLATALDGLVLFDRMALKPSWPLLKPEALVVADTRRCPELPEGDHSVNCRVRHLPLTRSALLDRRRCARSYGGVIVVRPYQRARAELSPYRWAQASRAYFSRSISIGSAGRVPSGRSKWRLSSGLLSTLAYSSTR